MTYTVRVRAPFVAAADSTNELCTLPVSSYTSQMRSAASSALATLYHFGDAMPQNLKQAASLYEAAYNNGVTWAARGLAILYEDFSFGNYNPELAKEWLKKFEGL